MNLPNVNLSFNADRIARIAREVQEIARTKRDFVSDRKSMSVQVVDGSLALRMEGLPQPDGTRGPDLFSLTRDSTADLCGTLDVPAKFLERLVGRGHGDVAASTLTTLLAREPKRHLVRTLGGRARAILSDSYRTLDNYDLMVIALREVQAVGAQVWDLRHQEDGRSFSLIAVHPAVAEQVRDDVPGAHAIRRLDGRPDLVYPGIKVSNSETGGGKWSVAPFVFRAICKNGMTLTQAIGQVHLGRKRETLGEIVYSDETKRLEDEVILRKTREVIQGTFDRERFQRTVETLNATTQQPIEKPTEAVDAAIKVLGIPEEHREAILEGLLGSRDKTQFGLAQAVTALANPDNRGSKPDDLLDLLEAAGGRILQASPREFAQLVGAR